MEMCLFIALSDDIIGLILREWLKLKEVTFVDSAFCNHKQRNILLANVFPQTVLQVEPKPLQANSSLVWLTKRKISMNVLIIFAATAIPKCRHFLKTSSKSVKHVKAMMVRGAQLMDLLSILSACCNMTSLSIVSCQLTTTQRTHTWSCPPMLNSFSIDIGKKCSAEKDTAIEVIRSSYQQLQRLELLIQPEFVLHELVDIKAFPWLIALSISCADNILDSDVIAAVRKAPHLQHINVSMCELLTDATGVYIAENVSQLKTLDLSRGNFTESTLTALAELRGNSLHALNISNCVSVHYTDVRTVLNKCHSLRILHVAVRALDFSLVHHPTMFQKLTHLTVDESGKTCSLEYARHIPFACKSAQYICFISHHVSYREIDFSAYTSQNMPYLQAINISSYPLPSPGICPTLDALQVQRPKLDVTFDPLLNNFDVMKISL